MIRVTLADKYLMPAKGVRRVIHKTGYYRVVDFDLTNSPMIITKEVQDYLLANLGHDEHSFNALIRYYYEGERYPSTADLNSAPKLSGDLRRWTKRFNRTQQNKEERFILFRDEDEEFALQFMLKFGSAISRKTTKDQRFNTPS